MTYSLSATKLVTYKQCPQAYNFRYERGISAPGAFGSPDFGNALHQALAIAYRGWHKAVSFILLLIVLLLLDSRL